MLKRLFSGITFNVFILGMVSLFTDLSSQMVFPLIPLYLTTVLGAGAYVVGLVEGAAETTASFFKIISGYLSDKMKKRRIFVQIGYALSAASKPLFALTSLWPVLLTVRVVERFGKGLRDAPRDAIVAETVEPANRGKAFGFQRAMDGLGSVLGAVAAFVFLPIFGYQKIFLYAFLPGLLAVFFTLFIKEKKRLALHEIAPEPAITLKGSFKDFPFKLKLFLVVSFLFTMGQFGYAFIMLKAKAVGAADENIILYYVLFYLIYTLLSVPFGALSDKIGRRYILGFGFTLFAGVALGLAFASSVYLVMGLFCVFGVFFALTDGASRAYVTDLSPKNVKATALGAFHTAIGLAALPGGYFAGILWDKVGPTATFYYGFILAVGSLALFLFIKEKKYGRPNIG